MERARPPSEQGRGLTLFALGFSALFAAPLLADPLARWLGFYVFLLADLRIQLVWAAGLLLFALLPALLGAWRELRSRRVSTDLVLVVASLAAYLYGGWGGGTGNLPVRHGVLQALALSWIILLALRLRAK